MSTSHQPLTSIGGYLESEGQTIGFEVARANPHTLNVSLHDPKAAKAQEFEQAVLDLGEPVHLGRCRFEPHPGHPRRRAADPPQEPGHGRLTFLDDLYDFSTLFGEASVGRLDHKIAQLGIVWRRKAEVRPAFRQLTSDLLFDLQVYRSIFDGIDRSLEKEPAATRVEAHRIAVEQSYGRFRAFLAGKKRSLEQVTADLTRQEHEAHGFYFRKQAWDMILASAILRRTNLKPRGYPGDSRMMRYIYEQGFVGDTIFAKMMHRFPLETAASQAVRNRRVVITQLIRQARRASAGRRGGGRFRLMSVAAGEAAELGDLMRTRAEAEQYEALLLDQDQIALAEAGEMVRRLEAAIGTSLHVRRDRDSVRTMLRTPRLSDRWGKFHFVYAMGLFDYLTQPVAVAVLAKLYELLLPGGELVIGNFHPRNPTRTYMEYWADWVVYYRDEYDLLALADGLPGAECSTAFETAGAQMFLRVTRSE